jgi:hypothetical protein
VAGQWANADPAAAAAWVAGFPDGQAQQNAMQSVINQWSANDPVAAGNWLKTLPAGDGKDAAITTYVGQVVNSDPAAAMAWAQSIGSEDSRNTAIENTARQWLQSDPTAATTWINNSSLPAETKASLLQPSAAGGDAMPTVHIPSVELNGGSVYIPTTPGGDIVTH